MEKSNCQNPNKEFSESERDHQWLMLAKKRLLTIENGEALLISAEIVFAKMKERFQEKQFPII